MKKIVYMFVAVLLFASCEKEEIGGTATEALAGQWYVHVDAVKDNGEILEVIYQKDDNGEYVLDKEGNKIVEFCGEDPFGLGNKLLLTYNTSANTSDTIFVDDLENIWDFKVKVSSNTGDRTFGNTDFADNYKYESGVKITDGQVLSQAATTPSGMPADSIVFYVEFDDDYMVDDEGNLVEDDEGNPVYVPKAYGFKNYRISGYRYTGFESDN